MFARVGSTRAVFRGQKRTFEVIPGNHSRGERVVGTRGFQRAKPMLQCFC